MGNGDSLCCILEINIRLYIQDTSIYKKSKEKKHQEREKNY